LSRAVLERIVPGILGQKSVVERVDFGECVRDVGGQLFIAAAFPWQEGANLGLEFPAAFDEALFRGVNAGSMARRIGP